MILVFWILKIYSHKLNNLLTTLFFIDCVGVSENKNNNINT